MRSIGTSFPSQHALGDCNPHEFCHSQSLRFPIFLNWSQNANQIALPPH
jgi:hypothetical protein